ncbi:MAG: hypothetical protein OJF49_003230 [Ktedonobacterales bacterium]|jgi:phage head maturation protease|nr:MAG: hypothetical protein OJF49_003230 [Ktedonobacterales bacterium]
MAAQARTAKTPKTVEKPLEKRAAAAGEAVKAERTLTRVALPCSIRIVDEERREVEICATSEALDSYGTVFDYDASKDAFTRWIGNVREMHERKAVGQRVAVRYDDDARKVYARVRISAGAEDTWEKVKDGTLRGASIGASNVEWRTQRRTVGGGLDGRETDVPVATRYDLVELSLVDNPSNPDAVGVTFIRNGEVDAERLEYLQSLVGDYEGDAEDEMDGGLAGENRTAVSGPAPSSVPTVAAAGLGSAVATPAPSIIERNGSLSTVDPAEAIAAAALKRGMSGLRQVAAGETATPESGQLSAYHAKLARLGAPGYANYANGDSAERVAAAPAPGQGTSGYGVQQGYDVDGDHESPDDYISIQSGPTAGAVMAPSPEGSVAHMAHSHHHTGRYDDPADHTEISAHMHQDGTSHTHEHVMDHQHGGHEGFPNGHTHPHVHVPEHSHVYRCADGEPLDPRVLAPEEARKLAYVSAAAFRSVGGIEGQALSDEQFRAAVVHHLRLAQGRLDSPASEQAATHTAVTQADAGTAAVESRALGPYSRNPGGPADAGTPDMVDAAATETLTGEAALGDGNGGMPALGDVAEWLTRRGTCPLCQGQVRALDRDGKAIAGADANGAVAAENAAAMAGQGTLDVSTPPDGWTGRGRQPDAPTSSTGTPKAAYSAEPTMYQSVFAQTLTSEVTRAVEAQTRIMAAALGDLKERLARIEAQPQAGGPVLRAAEKSTALHPNGTAGTQGAPGAGEQIRALEALAGRVTDPQIQVALAAEMIRLQQEQAGLPPAMMVMPRAGLDVTRRQFP